MGNDAIPLDQPAAIRAGEQLDAARLAAFLREHGVGTGEPLAVEQFPGGMSNLTYLVRSGTRELVLRRPPFGANIKGGHDMAREYAMLQALVGSYRKAPQPLLFCDDLAILGAPFYLMERVRGVILRRPPPVALDATTMQRVAHALIDGLAELHALDVRAAGFAGLGKPEGYTARQVAGWTRRFHNARTDDSPDMASIAVWLAANLPTQTEAALIHNDYKHDNLVLDPNDLTRIVAVLDWEMATIGDPLTDLGTTLAYWIEPEDPVALHAIGLTTLPGNPDRAQVLAWYAAQRGRSIEHVLFYFVYGLFKNATIVQQIYARYRQGHTADLRFAPLIEIVRAYAAVATQAIAQGRISHLF